MQKSNNHNKEVSMALFRSWKRSCCWRTNASAPTNITKRSRRQTTSFWSESATSKQLSLSDLSETILLSSTRSLVWYKTTRYLVRHVEHTELSWTVGKLGWFLKVVQIRELDNVPNYRTWADGVPNQQKHSLMIFYHNPYQANITISERTYQSSITISERTYQSSITISEHTYQANIAFKQK